MRLVSAVLTTAMLAAAMPATAQSIAPRRAQDNDSIVVTGTRTEDGKPIPMSDWRVAETQHLLVFSKGDEKRLTRIAHNLEKLHFLLSVLLNRVDEPDDSVKLSVTLIGDYADYEQLNLRNLRWQQGPFPKAFPSERYYDPREDGAVLATTHLDQKIVLQQGVMYNSPLVPTEAAVGQNFGSDSGSAPAKLINEISFPMTAAGRLYAGFAQHYLMTYFPAAYPRWYLDGFGEVFATISAEGDGAIEYGRRPEGFRDVTEWYGRYPLKNVFSGQYLAEKRGRTSWNPYRAWALTHLLFFSEEHKAPLHRYLAAVARGAAPEEAAKAFGDVEKLERELASYQGRKVPFERMTYPPERAPAPLVRQLTKSEAGFVRGRLELGARIEIPPPPAPGANPDEAADRALARRADWLERLRENATRYPKELELQLLHAEAECRSGNSGSCEAAADRALALAPKSAPSLAWKGIAMAQEALAAPASERKAKLRAARATIVRANRAEPDAVLPLLAYYRSFMQAGETPPAVAVDGVAKAVDAVPSAPASRLELGRALAGRGEAKAARRTLLPVAKGPYESPEKPKARALLEALQAK